MSGLGVVVSVHSCVWVESMKSYVLILTILYPKEYPYQYTCTAGAPQSMLCGFYLCTITVAATMAHVSSTFSACIRVLRMQVQFDEFCCFSNRNDLQHKSKCENGGCSKSLFLSNKTRLVQVQT